MKNSDVKQILANLVWSIIGGFLSYGVNFFLTPYIVSNCGIDAYGFVSLGNTLISYINIIAVGLNSFAARFVAVHYHKKEYDDANSVYSSVLIANIALSVVIIIIIVPLLYRLDRVLEIPDKLIDDVELLFLFVLFNYILNLFNSVISIVAFINNKTGITARIKSVSSIIYMISIIFLFLCVGVNIYFVGLANLLASACCIILTVICSMKIDNILRFSFRRWSFIKVKEVLSAGIFNSINSLGGTLGSGLDLFITNRMLNNIIMGQISVGNQIGTVATMATSLVAGVFQPKQLEAYSKGDIDSLINQLLVSMKVCGFIGGAILIVFALVGHSFISIWLPGQQIDIIFSITLIILIGNAIVAITTPLYYVMTLTLKMNVVCLITVLCGLSNVLSMIFLINKDIEMGPFIVVGTTSVLNLVALFIFPWLSKKYLNLSYNPFCELVIKYLMLIFVMTLSCIFVSRYININGLTELFCVVFIIGVIILIVYFFVMLNSYEKNRVKSFVKIELNR